MVRQEQTMAGPATVHMWSTARFGQFWVMRVGNSGKYGRWSNESSITYRSGKPFLTSNPTQTTRKTIAVEAEKRRRLELERAYAGLPTRLAVSH